MMFNGISRVFDLTDEQQYNTIGQFWDEMASVYSYLPPISSKGNPNAIFQMGDVFGFSISTENILCYVSSRIHLYLTISESRLHAASAKPVSEITALNYIEYSCIFRATKPSKNPSMKV